MSILSDVGALIGAKLREHKDLIDANTAKSAEIDNKLDQQSSVDVEIITPEAGVILTSPSGSKFRIQIDDQGRLNSTPIA